MSEPIKCPFCGRIPTVEDCGTNRWFVRCQCGIAQDKLYHQRCDAVRAWNRRKPITDVPSAVVGTKMSLANCISRKAAIDALNRHLDTIPVTNNNTMEMIRRSEVMDCRGIINGLPSAQPEIIRCKDCKYHDERYRRISVKWLPCMEIRTDGNWFCASAERREE